MPPLLMDVDPAQFIIRRDTYEQMPGFPEEAARVTQELILQAPANFGDAYQLVNNAIRESPVLNRDWRAKRRKGFGRTRTSDNPIHTDMEPKYPSDSKELRQNYPEGDTTLTYRDDGYHEPVTLSKISIKEDGAKVQHPDVGDEALMDERRWGLISRAYGAAMDEAKPLHERERSSIECYALLSHDCPDIRGSSLLARIVLEYLSHHVGFEVPFAKADLDFNTKAISRTPEQFIQEWESGDYFDRSATSAQVMAWHTERLIADRPALRP
jgi:hypothetical protein